MLTLEVVEFLLLTVGIAEDLFIRHPYDDEAMRRLRLAQCDVAKTALRALRDELKAGAAQ